MGLLQGRSPPWWGARRLPISVNGASPLRNGAFPLRNGPFFDHHGPFFPECLNGPFSLLKIPWKTGHQEKGHEAVLDTLFNFFELR